MNEIVEFDRGNYAFVRGAAPYSAAVVAAPGYEIHRVRFLQPVAMAHGFRRIASVLTSAGRPLTAICGCELRSATPFTEAGFGTFNADYVSTLADWGLIENGLNPVARSNVCPVFDAPREPSFHAFSFTVPAATASRSTDRRCFIISGGAELLPGETHYQERVVSRGDLSASGLRRKAAVVLERMEDRLAAIGVAWRDTTAVQLYCVHDIHPFLADEIVRRGAARHGLTWHFNRPPLIDLEYEMDCRGVYSEQVLPA